MKIERRIAVGGFSLLELLIVLSLAVLAFSGFRVYQQRQFAERQQERMVDEYVNDYTALARAVRNYTQTREGSWVANSVNPITLAQLIAAGELPAGFGTRPTGAGQTVLGQTIRIVAIRNAAANATPTVITETGSANGALLELAGLKADGSDVLPFKRRAASKIAALQIPAGTVPTGVRTVTGAGSNAWTKDLTAYFATNPAQSVVAGLIGFPDLDLIYDPSPIGSASNWGDCPVATTPVNVDGFPTANATCPVGTTEVGSWPACGSVSGIYSVGFTSVTIGYDVGRYTPALGNTCDQSISGGWSPPCSPTLQNIDFVKYHTVNNAVVSQTVCAFSKYIDTGTLIYWPTPREANPAYRHKLCCYPRS